MPTKTMGNTRRESSLSPNLYYILYFFVSRKERLRILATEIITRSNTQLATILIVIVDTNLDKIRLFTITFNSAINRLSCCPKPLADNRVNIGQSPKTIRLS